MEVRSGPAATMDGDARNPSPPRTCVGCRPSPVSSSTGLRLCCSDLEEGVELLLLLLQGWMVKLHIASTMYEMKSHILLKDQLQIRADKEWMPNCFDVGRSKSII